MCVCECVYVSVCEYIYMCCVALIVVCLTFACFFLPPFSSLIRHVYTILHLCCIHTTSTVVTLTLLSPAVLEDFEDVVSEGISVLAQ